MISHFGNIFLSLAFVVALLQTFIPLYGYYKNNKHALAFAPVASYAQVFFTTCAYGLLTFAFALNDFTIQYVAANSHSSLPLLYRLAAVWGAHEGSVLLWIFLLAIWTFVFAITQKRNQQSSLVIAILGAINACFLLFLLLTSNPFIKATFVSSGNDLNPLLQDPGFIIHPPILYIGYVGFSVAFAITQAALLTGQLEKIWAMQTKQFALAAWAFLTLGITLGSWWAYRVLGWGGFWFWDPVENASLLPWLSGLAMIHVLILVEKRNFAIRWASLLSLITFALSLLGTFLVRSGILISAHTFANDPARGFFLLMILTVVGFFALLNYVRAFSNMGFQLMHNINFISRETGLLLNSALLITAMLTILFGTLYPLLMNSLNLGDVSVGAPYFNIVLLPILLCVMFLMAAAVIYDWQQKTQVYHTVFFKKLVLSILITVLFLVTFNEYFDFLTFITITLSILIFLSLVKTNLKTGVILAHAGFAILILGIVLSSVFSEEVNVRIKTGEAANVGPYDFLFVSTIGITGSNYRGIRAQFDVTKNNHLVTTLFPEKRIYTIRDTIMTTVDIEPGLFRDLYIALGEPLDSESWSVRIYYKPFIRWIWLGGFIMMFGGIISILKKFSNRKIFLTTLNDKSAESI